MNDCLSCLSRYVSPDTLTLTVKYTKILLPNPRSSSMLCSTHPPRLVDEILVDAHQGGYLFFEGRPMKFAKPALDPSALLAKLQTLGLQIPDPSKALHHLRFIGYYRLAGYAQHFRQMKAPGKPFLPGTTFDNVLDLYSFDRELRLLVIDAVERVEVAVRGSLVSEMSVRYSNPHWFMDCLRYDSKYNYIGQLLAKVERDTSISKEQFILNYKAKYTEPRLPPAWMMVENLTLGSLSHLFAALHNVDRKPVAAPCGVDEHFLKSWLHSLNYLRNLCAHHARLWNRTFSIKPMIAKKHSAFLNLSQADRFYALAVVLFELVQTVSPGTGWHHRLKALLAAHSAVPLSTLGFPANWAQEPFWNPT